MKKQLVSTIFMTYDNTCYRIYLWEIRLVLMFDNGVVSALKHFYKGLVTTLQGHCNGITRPLQWRHKSLVMGRNLPSMTLLLLRYHKCAVLCV